MTAIKIRGEFTSYQFQKIIESFPNLEAISLKEIHLIENTGYRVVLKNQKIKSFDFLHKFFFLPSRMKKSYLRFFDIVRFADNTLENAKIVLHIGSIESTKFDRKCFKRFLSNQNLLTKREEGWEPAMYRKMFTLNACIEEKLPSLKN